MATDLQLANFYGRFSPSNVERPPSSTTAGTSGNGPSGMSPVNQSGVGGDSTTMTSQVSPGSDTGGATDNLEAQKAEITAKLSSYTANGLSELDSINAILSDPQSTSRYNPAILAVLQKTADALKQQPPATNNTQQNPTSNTQQSATAPTVVVDPTAASTPPKTMPAQIPVATTSTPAAPTQPPATSPTQPSPSPTPPASNTASNPPAPSTDTGVMVKTPDTNTTGNNTANSANTTAGNTGSTAANSTPDLSGIPQQIVDRVNKAKAAHVPDDQIATFLRQDKVSETQIAALLPSQVQQTNGTDIDKYIKQAEDLKNKRGNILDYGNRTVGVVQPGQTPGNNQLPTGIGLLAAGLTHTGMTHLSVGGHGPRSWQRTLAPVVAAAVANGLTQKFQGNDPIDWWSIGASSTLAGGGAFLLNNHHNVALHSVESQFNGLINNQAVARQLAHVTGTNPAAVNARVEQIKALQRELPAANWNNLDTLLRQAERHEDHLTFVNRWGNPFGWVLGPERRDTRLQTSRQFSDLIATLRQMQATPAHP